MSVDPQHPQHPVFGPMTGDSAPAPAAPVSPGRTVATARLAPRAPAVPRAEAPRTASTPRGPAAAAASTDDWVRRMQDDSPEAIAVQRRLAGPLPSRVEEEVDPFEGVDPYLLGLHFGTPAELTRAHAVQQQRAGVAAAPAEGVRGAMLTRAQLAIAGEHNLAWHARLLYSPDVFGGGDVASGAFAQRVAKRQHELGLKVDGIAGPVTCDAVGASTKASRAKAGAGKGEPAATAGAASTEASRGAEFASLAAAAGEGPAAADAIAPIEETRGRREENGAADRASLAAIDAPKEVPEERTTLAIAPVQARSSTPRSQSADDTRAIAARGVSGRGGPLPFLAELKPLFGASGSVLDGVRSHVNPVAVQAARAIGADAYATGTDIVFAVEPTRELVGHEAAHIVQQRAGVSLSGGVGAVGDPYEQQADQVGALVASGQSVAHLFAPGASAGMATAAIQRRSVGTAPTAESPPVHVDADPMEMKVAPGSFTGQMARSSDEAGAAVAAQSAAQPPVVLEVSNAGATKQAADLAMSIERDREKLLQGVAQQHIDPSVLETNQRTVDALETFASSSAEEGRTLGDFQKQHQVLDVDVARLFGAVDHVRKTNPGLIDAGVVPGLGGVEFLQGQAGEVIKGGTDGAWMGEQSEEANITDAITAAHAAQIALGAARTRIVVAQRNLKAHLHREAAPPAAVARAESEASIAITQVITWGAGELGAAGHAVDAVDTVAKYLAESATAAVDQLEAAYAGEGRSVDDGASALATIAAVRTAIAEWRQLAVVFAGASKAIAQRKQIVRNASGAIARVAEGQGFVEIAIVAQLHGECAAAAAQCDLVIGLGEIELKAARLAATDRGGVVGESADRAEATGSGQARPTLTYFEPVASFHVDTPSLEDMFGIPDEFWSALDPTKASPKVDRTDGLTYDAVERTVLMGKQPLREDGVSPRLRNPTPVVARVLDTLRVTQARLRALHTSLDNAMLRGSAQSTRPTATPPTGAT